MNTYKVFLADGGSLTIKAEKMSHDTQSTCITFWKEEGDKDAKKYVLVGIVSIEKITGIVDSANLDSSAEGQSTAR